MNSLFMKIFLWFWLAMSLVVAAFVVSVVGTSPAPAPPDPDRLVSRALDTVGHAALEMLSCDGPSKVHEFIERVSSTDEIRFSVFSKKHPELSEDSAPVHVRDLISDARADDELHHLKDKHGFACAKTIRSEQGDAVVVLFQAPHFRTFLEAAAEDPRAIALRIAAVILAGGVVCYWLARSLTAPLRRLSSVAGQLAKGNLSVRVGPELVKCGGELGELAENFDRMAGKIEAFVSAQQRLLRDVSHELRSPLARLIVALALARQKPSADAADALDRIEREAERLNNLIGQLLALARLDSNLEEPGKEVRLDALLETIVDDARFEAASRGSSVRLVKSDPSVVMAHPGLLFCALENVIRNAVRYTDEGTTVEISLESSGGGRHSEVGIRIRDHGPGVPECELASILQPFYTVNGNRTTRSDGTGLGLSIADRAIEQLGGTLSLSNAPDGGLVVEIRLPSTGESCRS